MAKNPKIDIDHVSKLASLPIPEDQKRIFSNQLTKILDYIEKIEKADTKNIDPTFNVTPNTNVTRKDSAGACLTQDEALQNSKNIKNGQFVTKGVFESE